MSSSNNSLFQSTYSFVGSLNPTQYYRVARHYRWSFAVAFLVLALVSASVMPIVYAGIQANTIDPSGAIAVGGHQIHITGPIMATQGEEVHLKITVTQRTTGAIAEGEVKFVATGAPQHWQATAHRFHKETFAEGPAVAVAVARTTLQGKTTDSHQWLVPIMLVQNQ